MRTAAFAALALTGLAACSGAVGIGPVAPARVILYRDNVTVQMSDRSFCTGPRAARSGAWQGRLAGCPHGWGFVVDPGPQPAPPRRVLVPDGPGPGRVDLTEPSGRVRHYGSSGTAGAEA